MESEKRESKKYFSHESTTHNKNMFIKATTTQEAAQTKFKRVPIISEELTVVVPLRQDLRKPSVMVEPLLRHLSHSQRLLGEMLLRHQDTTFADAHLQPLS